MKRYLNLKFRGKGRRRERKMRRRKKTDPRIERLMEDLKRIARERSAPIWKDIAKRLDKPRRNYAEVNLSKINRYSNANDTIVVPGKVLSAGAIEKPITIAALGFSKKAYEKVSSHGKCMSIEELMETNPKGSGLKIIA
ncbi:MAG: 50S ribosomal protein L18e [archaeon]|nr:50S ribosomal protein L18e [archaeon]